MTSSRRHFLKLTGSSAMAALIGISGTYPSFASLSTKYSARAIRLMERSLVIDMLSGLRVGFTPAVLSWTLSEQEINDFRNSGLTAMHHASGKNPRGPAAFQDVLAHLAAWNGFVAHNSALFLLVSRAEDLDRAKANGKIGVIMGLQNAEHFRTVDDVLKFWQLGQRCGQLTYNEQNLIGSGSTERVDGGLSDYGVEIVNRMNQVGMLVDVSHCGDRTTLDAIDISSEPIAISHSNCRALNNHPRLKTDEAIRKLAAKGGVIGITSVRHFVRDREPTTIEHMVDHIDHVAKLVGIEHVGIGTDSDLNGLDDMPKDELSGFLKNYKASYAMRQKMDTDGFDNPMRFFELTEVLIRRGYSDANIEAILGGNFKRLLGTAWDRNGE